MGEELRHLEEEEQRTWHEPLERNARGVQREPAEVERSAERQQAPEPARTRSLGCTLLVQAAMIRRPMEARDSHAGDELPVIVFLVQHEPVVVVDGRLLAGGTKPNLAKVTVARKIAAIVLAMWKTEEVYDPAKHRKPISQ